MTNNNMGMDKFNSNFCNDNEHDNFINSCFFSLPPKQFTLLSSIIGLLLIDNLNVNQQNSLGNFFVNIGQSLLTAAGQEQLLISDNQNNK